MGDQSLTVTRIGTMAFNAVMLFCFTLLYTHLLPTVTFELIELGVAVGVLFGLSAVLHLLDVALDLTQLIGAVVDSLTTKSRAVLFFSILATYILLLFSSLYLTLTILFSISLAHILWLTLIIAVFPKLKLKVEKTAVGCTYSLQFGT